MTWARPVAKAAIEGAGEGVALLGLVMVTWPLVGALRSLPWGATVMVFAPLPVIVQGPPSKEGLPQLAAVSA